MQVITKELIHSFFRPRLPESHKGSYGHALLVAGSPLRMGAAVIAAKACLRSGCGLLSVDMPFEERFILNTSLPEAMLKERGSSTDQMSTFSAVGIGPAIGIDELGYELFYHYLTLVPFAMVLDADAITLLSMHDHLWNGIKPGTVFTPHVKEFDRLFGVHEGMAHRIETAKQMAREKQIIMVLKSHQTYVTDGQQEYINTTGNAGLAKGGSGDALCGMILSFMAQGYPGLHASILACYLHGLAADMALKNQSLESLLISDVIECIGEAFITLNQV